MKLRALLIALLVLLTTGCGYSGMQDLPLPGGANLGADSYTVTADFDNVLDLAEQSTVRVDGVTVGRVEKITRHGWKARVRLRLRKNVPVTATTQATVAQTSLLGEKYVDLSASTGPRLAAGANIPIANTSRGSEVEEVLGALSLLLNGGGVAQLRTISQELHTALDSDSVDTRTFLRELDQFVTTLDRNRSTIVSALKNVDRLSATINADHSTVTAALKDIAPGVKTLNSQQKQLVSMFKHLSSFGDVSSDVIRKSGADLTADLKALEPVLAELEKAGDTLPQTLEDVLSFPFPDEVLNAVKGDYVNLAVEVDLSTSIISSVTGGELTLPGIDEVVPGLLPAGPELSGNTESSGGAGSLAPSNKPDASPAPTLLELLLTPLQGLPR